MIRRILIVALTASVLALPATAQQRAAGWLQADAFYHGVTNDFGDWVTIRTEMTARVYETLAREGIDSPFPQQAVHLRSVSPEVAQRVAGAMLKEQDAPRPA